MAGFFLLVPVHSTPGGHSSGRRRITAAEQNGKLVGLKPLGGCRTLWPPRKPPLREPLLTQPEALTVVDQDLDRFAALIAEDENTSTERIFAERLATDTGQTIDTFAKIGRLDSHPDSHLGSYLDHLQPLRKTPATALSSDGPTPRICIRTVAPQPSAQSSTHSTAPGFIAAGKSSMNSG